ncbi:MAG: carbohydrate ABC transporter permease [Clostridiaceae bacterium]|jgi:putative aldouronate transport system permease protein|nr:carbohydrate ABC transporter permease [Clostridiaceae bacterium]
MSVRKLTVSDRIYMAINYTILAIFALSALYPFIYFLALSFNDGYDAMRGGIYLFPREFTLDNYKRAFSHPQMMNAFGISIMRTVIVTVSSVILCAMMAYGLTKKGLPGRKYIIFFFFFTTLFGGGLIPTFILYRQIGIYNTFWVMVIPHLYSFFNAVVIRTFFMGIPASLPESATIDGASELDIFFRIMLPLSMPVLATIALFIGVGNWNDWFTGQFFIQNAKLKPAATFLNQMISEASYETLVGKGDGSQIVQINQDQMRLKGLTPESLRMTFVIIITVPIVCVYPFLQKYFVKGVLLGSLKE